MVASKTFVWICFALCVALGGSKVFYGKKGGDVLMDCGAADLNQELDWKFDNDLLIKVLKSGQTVKGSNKKSANKARQSGSKLKISSLEFDDSGIYSCNGKDSSKKDVTTTHTLYVMSVSVSPSQTVMHSTDVTLNCEVQKASPAQIQWLNPDKTPYGNSNNVITLKSINSNDAGRWTCQVKENDEKEEIEVDISVLGPLTSAEEVIAPAKGSANLTCSIPDSTRISKGGWSRDPPNGLKFPTLERDSKGLKWSTENTSPKVMFSKEPLSTDFTVTLKNVKPNEDGRYVCTVIFQDGRNLSTALTLKIDENKRDSTMKLGGVEMWVWVTTAAALVVVIGLVVSTVLIHRRNKQMRRKVRKLKTMRQPLSDRIYCQCNRTDRQHHPGKRGRPPPLPGNQYDVME